jgi:acyl dehydratase
MAKSYPFLSDLQPLQGGPLGVSEWILVDQARIDAFAAATGDRQWIHVDPELACNGPFGGTIAHGFLSLSLLPALFTTAFSIENVRLSINYGLNRVRFPAVLPSGSRIRGHFILQKFESLEEGAQLVVDVSIEREGHTKPVCIAECVLRHLL